MNKAQSQRGSSCLCGRQFGETRAWVIALAAVFLVAMPTIRMNESCELDTAKERVEEVSVLTRSFNLKRLSRHVRRERVEVVSAPVRLGYARQHGISLFSGHRLPNGLMAPMTC